jgi:hypothetical protein
MRNRSRKAWQSGTSPFLDLSIRSPAGLLAALRQTAVEIQALANKQYKIFARNPSHSSLRFKQVGPLWSVRITRGYRALALREGRVLTWFWIGTHSEYERLIR